MKNKTECIYFEESSKNGLLFVGNLFRSKYDELNEFYLLKLRNFNELNQ